MRRREFLKQAAVTAATVALQANSKRKLLPIQSQSARWVGRANSFPSLPSVAS